MNGLEFQHFFQHDMLVVALQNVTLVAYHTLYLCFKTYVDMKYVDNAKQTGVDINNILEQY